MAANMSDELLRPPLQANLIRLSIGLEAVEDLIGNLEQALAGI
jgi:cystathionine beta-lyase/cystathionine gamma-synthase